jgi:hypothetical protein
MQVIAGLEQNSFIIRAKTEFASCVRLFHHLGKRRKGFRVIEKGFLARTSFQTCSLAGTIFSLGRGGLMNGVGLPLTMLWFIVLFGGVILQAKLKWKYGLRWIIALLIAIPSIYIVSNLI